MAKQKTEDAVFCGLLKSYYGLWEISSSALFPPVKRIGCLLIG